MNIEYAMKNPYIVFTSPESLEKSPQLTAAQKRDILMQWKDQLRQLLIADDESMLRADAKPGTNAECLRRVSDAMRRLRLESMKASFPTGVM